MTENLTDLTLDQLHFVWGFRYSVDIFAVIEAIHIILLYVRIFSHLKLLRHAVSINLNVATV